MNARVQAPASAPLHRIALAACAVPGATGPEAAWLAARAEACPTLTQWLEGAAPEDEPLVALGAELRLDLVEAVAVALAAAVEFDPMLARALAWLQQPAGGTRPTLGLMDTLAAALGLREAGATIAEGRALASGLLQWDDDETRPLPERALRVPLPIALALRGRPSEWPGATRIDPDDDWPASLREAAARQAAALRDGGALAVRSGHPHEARLGAAAVAAASGRAAIVFEQDWPPGAGPWLWLRRAIPVLCRELAPGETHRLTAPAGHRGPVLVVGGLDGGFEHLGGPVQSWTLPLPTPQERTTLWSRHLGADEAREIGFAQRHGAAAIRHLARAAQRVSQLSGDTALLADHVRRAAREGGAGDLGSLAQLLPDEVPDEALVVPPDAWRALDTLCERCRRREGLAAALGPAARTRYRPGVRALLVGPSGTGKTLAAGWLATRLGLPLYRVDLASVVSKYIGETEKNLAQLFARAEHAEVVLLFDEADSLFGKRTDVKESNDRFANQQTNYLLQRIECFEGIALLTSNSRSRFDGAFTRRLDMIVDFPSPGPEARRALWQAHLGGHHRLEVAQLNRIAGLCDLAGGHIRSATLAAAGRADGPIDYASLRAAIDAEYRKLGRLPPSEL